MRKYELPALLVILAILIVSTLWLANEARINEELYSNQYNPMPNHTYYYRNGSGYLVINKGDGPRLLTCNLSGWDRQMLYYRHDLPVVAEGCMILEPTNARAQSTSRMVPDL